MVHRRSILIILLTGVITVSLIVFLYQSNLSHQKEMKQLTSKIVNLEDELGEAEESVSELKNKISELEENEAEVDHFEESQPRVQRLSTRISEAPHYTGQVLKTQIDGDFNGWDGDTIFKMMDGTIWQQASYDYTYHYDYMPDVIIYNKGGTYYMKVEDVEEQISVNQIK